MGAILALAQLPYQNYPFERKLVLPFYRMAEPKSSRIHPL